MTARRTPYIPQRRTIFIGCEGRSEVGYAALLQDLLRSAEHAVHLDLYDLGHGGDPLGRIEMAVRRLASLQRRRTAPRERFVLLDSDQVSREPHRAERARQLASENHIAIVWQSPCHKAMLLRHLLGLAQHRPPDTRGAEQALAREWPDYRKPMSAANLARRLDGDALVRAARVEPELRALLTCLGLIDATAY